jgi:rare lipoprotein A (peptidoglycan hydrolase)
MVNFRFNGVAKLSATAILGITALTLGACGTTSGTMMAKGAPITYKMGQGNHQQTTKAVPYTNKLPTLLDPSNKVRLGKSKLNTKKVDSRLYAHQKVGKTYTIFGKQYTPKHQPRYDKVGTASWYGPKFHGKPTATGELYNMNDITAAHKTLPLNSIVMVTNVETGKSLKVRVNDRGPFVGDRIIDLSRTAANMLGLFESGLGEVRVQYAGPADPKAPQMAANRFKQKSPLKQWKKPTPKPQYVAQAPKYQPLRELGEKISEPIVQALPKLNLQKVMPKNVKLPNFPSGDLKEGPITLTIKGPIHMASDKNDGTYAKAEFISAVHYKTIPAKK